MDGEGIREILKARPTPQLVDIGGVKRLLVHSTSIAENSSAGSSTTGTEESWKEVATGPDVAPAALHLCTLTGLLDYIRANRDGLALEKCVVHVTTHAEVQLLGVLGDAPFHERHWYAQASFVGVLGQGFAFGSYGSREMFNVALQTLFVESLERNQILAIVGNIKEEKVRQAEDDGTTQTVTGRAGIVLGKEVKVPNPVILRPYRTFLEVDQPESQFVLRLRQEKEGDMPTCALFEADGGRWKLEAILRIRDYLIRELCKDSSTAGLAVLA